MADDKEEIPKPSDSGAAGLTQRINRSVQELWIQKPPATSTGTGGMAGITAKVAQAVGGTLALLPPQGAKRKKDVDTKGLPSFLQKTIDNLPKTDKQKTVAGVAGDHLIEPIPHFIEAAAEKVIANQNGSCIVLGRDRPASRASGYGGKANTQCASIDLVTGRMGAQAIPQADATTNENIYVDPNFEKDAARIIMSQKTNIDENFLLIPTANAPTSKGRASIGLKADTIRLVARENIRIVTEGPVFNSQGGISQSTTGIDLVAGNVDPTSDPRLSVQPFVKGGNLVYALGALIKQVQDLNGIVDALMLFQGDFNMAVMNHYHHSPFYGEATCPNEEVMIEGAKAILGQFEKCKLSLTQHKSNLVSFKANYLWPSGRRYINSRFNGTN
jgi:hypothetical protein